MKTGLPTGHGIEEVARMREGEGGEACSVPDRVAEHVHEGLLVALVNTSAERLVLSAIMFINL